MTLTINVKEDKYLFFLELINSLDFAQIDDANNEEDSHEDIVANIKQGLLEVKLVEMGKMKARPAKEFLDEL